MIMRLVRFVEKVPVIGWLIRTIEWAWEGIGYLLDERRDRRRYGKPIRFWMVWKKLGRKLGVAIREGAEKERNRKQGRQRIWKERGRGWIRGVQWVDRGVRGPEDRREMWLHSGDTVELQKQVEQTEVEVYEQKWVIGVDYGTQPAEVVFIERGINESMEGESLGQKEMAEADRRIQAVGSRYQEQYYKEFMEGYGKEGYGQRRKVMPVVSRGMGKTSAAKMVKKIMEDHGIEVKEVGETYGERLG